MIKLIVSEALPHISKMTVIISGDEKHCTLSLIPDSKEKGLKVTPISISGSAEEVEKNFAEAIKAVFTDNSDVFTNWKDVAKEVKAAGNKTAATTTVKKEEPVKEEKVKAPEYNKEQNNVIKKGKEAIEKAKQATDPEIVQFFENEYVRKYAEVKLGETETAALKAEFAEIRKKFGDDKEEKEDDNADGLFAKPAEDKKVEKTTAKKEDKVKEEKKDDKKADKTEKKEEKAATTTEEVEDGDGGMIF